MHRPWAKYSRNMRNISQGPCRYLNIWTNYLGIFRKFARDFNTNSSENINILNLYTKIVEYNDIFLNIFAYLLVKLFQDSINRGINLTFRRDIFTV